MPDSDTCNAPASSSIDTHRHRLAREWSMSLTQSGLMNAQGNRPAIHVRALQLRLLIARTIVLPWFIVMALAACQVPTRQLGEFRDTLSAARSIGEEVVLDYGVAKGQYEAILAENARSNPQRISEAERLAFDPASIGQPTADAVVTRMRAWAVLGRYGDALLALAEGRSADEVGGVTDGLLQAVTALSTDAAATIAPFAGTITTLVSGLQRAIEVKEFRRGVLAAAPAIEEVSDWLIEDAANFYNIRLGLRNIAYSRRTDMAADIRSSLVKVLTLHTHASTSGDLAADPVCDRLNVALMRLPTTDESELAVLPPPGSVAYTQTVHSQLEGMALDVEGLVAEALEIDGALLDYRSLLTQYTQLIRKMAAAHAALAQAVENPTLVLPPPADVFAFVVGVRKAFMNFQSRK